MSEPHPSAHHSASPLSGYSQDAGTSCGGSVGPARPPREHQLPVCSQGWQPLPASSVCAQQAAGGKPVYLFMHGPCRPGTALGQQSGMGIQSADGDCWARGESVTASHTGKKKATASASPSLLTVPQDVPSMGEEPAGSVPWSPERTVASAEMMEPCRNQQETLKGRASRGDLHPYCRFTVAKAPHPFSQSTPGTVASTKKSR